jgi:hypothetical protein
VPPIEEIDHEDREGSGLGEEAGESKRQDLRIVDAALIGASDGPALIAMVIDFEMNGGKQKLANRRLNLIYVGSFHETLSVGSGHCLGLQSILCALHQIEQHNPGEV